MVSIIIPCFNYGRFLADAIESIIGQTYQNWECIIVNDGSNDNTEAIVQKYASADKRFVYIQQENAGHSAARNSALKIATRTYIQFLDADDLLESEKLSLQVALMEADDSIDIIYSDVLIFRDDDPQKIRHKADFLTKLSISGKNDAILTHMINDNAFLPGCVLMKRTIYKKVGNLKASYGYEDWEFFSRVVMAGFSFYHDAREGTRLIARTHSNNTSNKHKKMLESKIKVRLEIMNVIRTFNKESQSKYSLPLIQSTLKKHNGFLAEDKTTYQVYYGNVAIGIKNMILHAYYSGKPFLAFTNALKWTYLRLKGHKV